MVSLNLLEVYHLRLRLLNLFRIGRLSLDEIEAVLRWRRVVISKHLAFLRARKLITVEQEQHLIFFRFLDESSQQLRLHIEAINDERDPVFQADIDELNKLRKKCSKKRRRNR